MLAVMSKTEAPAQPPIKRMQLGVLERRLTLLRPLFEYVDGKWKKIIGDSQWGFDIVPKNCTIISDGKALAQLREVISDYYPVRSDCNSGPFKNTFILAWKKKLPSSLLRAEMLDHALPVVGGTVADSIEGWVRVNELPNSDRTAVTSAFLRIEPSIHVCQQDPKIMMGADPNQRELDIHLQPKDLLVSALRSKQGYILVEVTPKYQEMCGKPEVFTGRWLFLPLTGKAIDLGYNLKLESYGDFNGDAATDFLFSIFADGNDGYVIFDGKTMTKSVNKYFYE
jgi:hypothetical protein